MTAANGYELVFEPDRERWSVASGNDTWSLSEHDGLTLASFMRLRVLALPSVSRPMPLGSAAVLSVEPDSVALKFVDHLGTSQVTLQELQPVKVSLAAADWIDGRFDDKWLATEGELKVVKAREVGLRLYLPKLVGLEDKSVFITIGDRDTVELVVTRGEVVEHWITLPPDLSTTTVLFTCAYAEPNTLASDQRDLGVVVTELNLDRTEWTAT